MSALWAADGPTRLMFDHDEQIESLLRRFRPVGASPNLRERIVTCEILFPRVAWAAAAMWLLISALWFESWWLDHRTAELLASKPVIAGPASDAVALLGGGRSAERYVLKALSNHGQIQLDSGG